MVIRWQLGFPGQPMPIGGVLPETMAPGGVVLPEFYNPLVTMHGTFMVFFAIMPLLVGVFGNYLIPLKIGAPDMAFPRINMASFWIAVPAGFLMLAASSWRGDTPPRAGPPTRRLSERADYSGVSMGQMLWCISLIVLGLSSILGSVNYITTIINMRAPGMTWFRLPLTIWALFVTAILVLLGDADPDGGDRSCCCSTRPSAPISSRRRRAVSRCCGSICSGSSAIRRSTS